MMKKLFCLTTIFSTFLFYSQQKIKIVDFETKKPISYAKITFKDKQYYKNSEENGEITLENNEEPTEIESFGYENFKVSKTANIYYLQPKYNNIDAIEITKPKFEKSFKIGTTKDDKFGFFASTSSWQIVDLFKNENNAEKLYIKKIKITTEVNKQIKEASFNLIIYSNENGNPSSEKIRSFIVKCKSGSNITEIDLYKSPILFPKEGLYIGIEWIMNNQNKFTYNANVLHADGSVEKNKNLQGISPKFKGHKTSESNILFNSNSIWSNNFRNRKSTNSLYSLSIQLELTN